VREGISVSDSIIGPARRDWAVYVDDHGRDFCLPTCYFLFFIPSFVLRTCVCGMDCSWWLWVDSWGMYALDGIE